MLIPSSLPDPIPRPLNKKLKRTPDIGSCRASLMQANTLIVMLPGIGFGLTVIVAGAMPGNLIKRASVTSMLCPVMLSVPLPCAQITTGRPSADTG